MELKGVKTSMFEAKLQLFITFYFYKSMTPARGCIINESIVTKNIKIFGVSDIRSKTALG